ncbi:MAG: LuxR C-terminal-related transcriptional regulator [Sulfobacillus sp.]
MTPRKNTTVSGPRASAREGIARGDDRVPIRVVVVDAHPLFRHRVMEVLHATGDIEVVGDGLDDTDAVELVERLKPDVLIMELSTPKRADLKAIEYLHVLSPQLKILILSVQEEEQPLFDAIVHGAQGYIIRMIDPNELVHAVRRVQDGEAVVPDDLMLRIFLSDRLHSEPTTAEMSLLTDREAEVLRELGTGATNKDIAKHLDISVTAVRYHVRQILQKLHMSNRLEASAYAMKEGRMKE